MDRLWAPWRLNFVAASKEPMSSCFLCRSAETGADARGHWLARRTARSCVVLNRFPYNNGHLLVAPLAHKATLDELTAEELADGMEEVRFMIRCLDAIMKPDGYNVGLNLGKAAGAGLPGHLHWHIVPRWHGDTNYMTTCADDRVIVQSLEAFYELLVAEIAKQGR
ncbi:MAG: HIT domain-containing protein [Gemmataceae bacterium]|nr:HIT domain-containing protein [Gemmataceae bacterium]